MYMDTVIVTGAGSEQANGTFIESGVLNGRPLYVLEGGSAENEDTIYWTGVQWFISNSGDPFYKTLNEDTEFPWLATSWTNEDADGELPIPTVTLFVPEPETENTFGLPTETVALITSRFGTVANFLRLRNQGQV
jgi:hypothetical protein